MKNTILAIALAAAGLAAVPATTQAQEGNAGNSAFFINGNVGETNLSKGAYDDSDTGWGVNGGYRWAFNPNVAVGIEVGYTDLGKFGVKNSLTGSGLPRAEVSGWTAGLNGHFNINPNWYISARGGLFRGDVKGAYFANGNYTSGGTVVYVDDTSTKYYAGAGFGYDFSNNFSVGLNYDYYKADKQGLYLDPNLVSVSGEYRF